ncbi:MAG: hypothetical protein J6P66_02685 [Bacteroidaceae bacterium]|nr:hypothetical protein [Bacteroidaceae bacterium]
MRTKLLTVSAALMAFSVLFLAGCEKEDKDAISMDEVNNGVLMIAGNNGVEYEVVDLGLSTGTLWAKCNMGATSPEQSGSFFAWGEVEPTKKEFDWSNYNLCKGDEFSFIKYCPNKDRGYQEFVDNKTVLDDQDNAAKKIMGSNWRIPSQEDYAELIYKCDIRRCKLNNVWGFLFTSKVNGNSLFMPLAGRMDQNKTNFKDAYGFYWSNKLDKSETAFILWLEPNEVKNNAVSSKSTERYLGLPIRPVTTR